MPEYLNTTWTGSPVCVPVSDRLNLPGQWVDIPFNHDIADAAGHHSGDSPLIGNGAPRFLEGKLLLRLDDFQPGVEIQIRPYEVRADGSRAETHEPNEFYTSNHWPPVDENGNYLYPPRTHRHEHIWSYINAGHRFGLEISQWPHDLSAPAGKIVKAQLVGTLTAP